MILAGIQKMSLVDYPGKVACTLFTGGCDLRCPFCHNSELLVNPPAALTEEQVLAFLKTRTGLLDGVCITGGEPCLHRDLPELIRSIRGLGFPVKLDTNGSFPDRLEQILSEGLVDYVAMDIKNSPERYAETVGLPRYSTDSLLRSLELLMRSGVRYELRTTVSHPFHDEDSFYAIRDMLQAVSQKTGCSVPTYYLQFFTDRDTVPFAGLSAPTQDEMTRFADILKPVADRILLRGEGQ